MNTHPTKLCSVIALSVLVAACQKQTAEKSEPEVPSQHGLLPADDVEASESIFLLTTKFTDQRGEPFTLESLRGGPLLISMFYASCPHACPVILQKMKYIESKIPEEQRRGLRVVLVSFDTERDTPERLFQMGELHGVEQTRWRLARADEMAVRELAAVLGIRYRQEKDGAIAHSSVITLVDQNGLIVERMTSLDASIEPIVRALSAQVSQLN